MSDKLYFEGLGRQCPIKDKDQIIWFLEQSAKGMNKNYQTRYWLNLKEWYKEKLLLMQAYEVLAFIESKTTDAQEKRRQKFREKQKRQAELELKKWQKWKDKHEMMQVLLKMVSPN